MNKTTTLIYHRGFVLQVETVGNFRHYAISKGASEFLVGHVHVDSETEQQVLARLKRKLDVERIAT